LYYKTISFNSSPRTAFESSFHIQVILAVGKIF